MTERKKLSEAYRKLFEALEEIVKYDKNWDKFHRWVVEKYHKDLIKDYAIWDDYWFLLEALRSRRLPNELENRILKDLALFYLKCEADPVVYERLSPWNWTLRELLFFFMVYYKLKFEGGGDI